MRTLQGPLAKVSADARSYPVHLLREGDTGLCLFAAAFLGSNDAIHMARMGMVACCVDIDEQRLTEMRELYPANWLWHSMDAWTFAAMARADGVRWDVVSVDTFTGEATDFSLETLALWCSISRRVVTATVTKDTPYKVPWGWVHELHPRSELADWLVLERG